MQYVRPSLSYHLSLRSLFFIFLSGRFTQVLLYMELITMMLNILTRNSSSPLLTECQTMNTRIDLLAASEVAVSSEEYVASSHYA